MWRTATDAARGVVGASSISMRFKTTSCGRLIASGVEVHWNSWWNRVLMKLGP